MIEYTTNTWEYFHQVWKTHLHEDNGKAVTEATNSFVFFGVEFTVVWASDWYLIMQQYG
jgi:hypothetical protein